MREGKLSTIILRPLLANSGFGDETKLKEIMFRSQGSNCTKLQNLLNAKSLKISASEPEMASENFLASLGDLESARVSSNSSL